MSAQGNNNKLPTNLPQLQNLIKRDPESYVEEFERQHSVYQATRVIFEQNPTIHNEQLYDLVTFMAQVAHCYTSQLSEFPQELVTVLKRHSSVLHPVMRMGLIKSLVLLRNKNLLTPTALLMLFFQLLRCQDKVLRKFLQMHIITDIKNINSKSKNMKLNKELQNFMFEMLKDNHAVAAKMSLDVMVELYKKQIWNDAKTVNIIATACFSKITKIMVAAMKFFVGRDEENEDKDNSGSESEEDMESYRQASLALRVNKKSKKKALRKVDKVKVVLKRNQKKKKTKSSFDFSALHLIHDPQNHVEKLYKRLEKMNERFEVKLLTMNIISRLIGIHQLYLPNFYPLVQRFLFPHQREVTKVMVYAAQAAHSQIPPEDLEPVVKALANNFVTERHSNEVMAMGLNAIRELCARNPHCMSEDLLQDLTQYRTHKDKGVMMAARSLIVLFREKNPELLLRKDRGVPTELRKEEKVQKFGEMDAKNYIPGAEIVSFKTDTEVVHKNLDNDSESEDGWINVSHSEADNDIESTSEEEEQIKEEDDKEPDKILTNKEAIREIMKLTPEERISRAVDVVSSRFLTDGDFARIAAAQAAKQVEKFSGNNKKVSKRKREVQEDKAESGEIVSLKSIEMIYKKRKHDKEARLDSIKSGREGREKFGAKKGRMNANASTTNKEKIRKKAFMMIKHKAVGKQKKSFRDKQIKLRNSLLKQRKFNG